MKSVSVDVALNKSGIAVFHDGRLWDSWLVIPKGTYHQKLLYLFSECLKVFGRGYDELVIEDRLEAGWSGASLAAIEAARVMVLLAWFQTHGESDYFLYRPGDVKVWLTGKRNASKGLMKSTALERWEEADGLPEDELDALCLFRFHEEKYRL